MVPWGIFGKRFDLVCPLQRKVIFEVLISAGKSKRILWFYLALLVGLMDVRFHVYFVEQHGFFGVSLLHAVG